MTKLDEAFAVDTREKRRRAVVWDLFRLATEHLGYDKLSEGFHRPMLEEWDRVDRRRFLRGKQIDTLDLWPRDHIKTWCERARVIRAYLVDPTFTVTWWHAVEGMAEESCEAVAKQLQFNSALRRLFPDGVLPSPGAKRFVGAKSFALRSNRIGDAPSMRAWGAGSEATGSHSRLGVLDDIVGYNDVVDSQMGVKRRWYQATVCNVVRSDGWKDGIGTRWDRDDPYSYWLAAGSWSTRVRACLETDGKADYKGSPVYLTAEQVQRKRADMGEYMFSLQMMNDPLPPGDRPWKQERETYIGVREAAGPGLVCVIGDTAPAEVGSADASKERARADGTKDEWVWTVVKLRCRGMRREIVVLDQQGSFEWNVQAGFRAGCRLMRKWQTPHVAWEDSTLGPGIRDLMAREATAMAREEGVKINRHEFTTTHHGKNQRWGALCARQQNDELFLCESLPQEEMDKLLDQCRAWRPMGGAKNGLRHDDRADSLSYAVDPELWNYAPRAEQAAPPVWYQDEEQDESGYGDMRTRYCGV